jgi:hypothetical protein
METLLGTVKPDQGVFPFNFLYRMLNNISCNSNCVQHRLKNVDRSTPMHKEVTVNNVTVVITEFRPKISSKSTSPSNLDLDAGHTTSSSSSASNHGNDLSPDQEHSD